MLSEWESNEQKNPISPFEGDIILNGIRQIFYNKQYDLVIEQTTKILEDLQQRPVNIMFHQKIAYVVELRIMAWEAKSCYVNALTDARELIKHAPHDPKGYLWSGQLYSRFDKQEQAIEILERGLKRVIPSPPNKYYYKNLKEVTQILEKQYHPKKDILISLPRELSCRILDELTQTTLVHCSNVSSSWRTLVINYPKIWRHTTIPVFKVDDICLPFYDLLPFITRHIQVLVVRDIESFKKCLGLMRKSNFKNLCTFKIYLRSYHRSKLDINYGDIYSSFSGVSDILTSLDFDFNGIHGLHLAPLLSILCNLTSLRFHVTWDNYNGGILGVSKMSPITLLTTLDLSYEKKYGHPTTVNAFTVGEIQQLVRSLPNVRQLAISSCPDEVYDEVTQHCPNIQQLIINAPYLRFTTINDESHGLKRLIPGSLRSGTSLESLLIRHASSIKTLHLVEEDVSADTTGTWDVFSTVNFSNLVHIIMSSVDPEISQQLPKIINGTSQLETLELVNIVDTISDSVFEAIVVKFPNFRNLTLRDCDFDDSALFTCLDSFATGNARSQSLEILDIYPSKEYTNDTVLGTCARIKSLKRLCVYNCDASQSAVDAFANDVANLTHLKDLTIYSLPMTEKDIQRIGMNSSIREVCFMFSKGIASEQARSAFSPDVFVRFGHRFDDSDANSDSLSDSYFMELIGRDDDFIEEI